MPGPQVTIPNNGSATLTVSVILPLQHEQPQRSVMLPKGANTAPHTKHTDPRPPASTMGSTLFVQFPNQCLKSHFFGILAESCLWGLGDGEKRTELLFCFPLTSSRIASLPSLTWQPCRRARCTLAVWDGRARGRDSGSRERAQYKWSLRILRDFWKMQSKKNIICELKHDSILLLPNLGKTPYLSIFFL